MSGAVGLSPVRGAGDSAIGLGSAVSAQGSKRLTGAC